jgi:hypothetical protein
MAGLVPAITAVNKAAYRPADAWSRAGHGGPSVW